MTNVLEYLENSAKIFGDKKAVEDANSAVSYSQLQNLARQTGSFLLKHTCGKKPIVVFDEKSVNAIISFMGIAYAGCFYVFISPEQPVIRINHILNVLKPEIVLTNQEHLQKLGETEFGGQVFTFEQAQSEKADQLELDKARLNALDTDPLYCNFTSGSTGVPKGVLVCHRSVIDFINIFPELFNITSKDIIGNQAPFDFDVSVKDIYSAFKTGATLTIIPKKYFSIPTALMDYLCEKQVTTLIWAVSALCIVSQLKAMTYKVPVTVNKVLFSGEAMPVKQLNNWKKYLPNALYVNLYGPTEITCNCTYYVIDRDFALDEKLPIGKPFKNERILILDENDNLVTQPNVTGELCVAGTCLALGYYNNPEQTSKAFVQNPLNTLYPETIYRTGDLVFLGEDGNYNFNGRKDFQIKLMGHRIELEELEIALNAISGINRACCVFDQPHNRIIAYYVGEADSKDVQSKLRQVLPSFMIPSLFKKIEQLPLNANGKIDRKRLLAEF